jgi:hypothetical protein
MSLFTTDPAEGFIYVVNKKDMNTKRYHVRIHLMITCCCSVKQWNQIKATIGILPSGWAIEPSYIHSGYPPHNKLFVTQLTSVT